MYAMLLMLQCQAILILLITMMIPLILVGQMVIF